MVSWGGAGLVWVGWQLAAIEADALFEVGWQLAAIEADALFEVGLQVRPDGLERWRAAAF